MVQTAGVVTAVLLLGVATLQVLLASGRPWGHLVYGGRAGHVGGVLTAPWRVASGAAAAVLVGMAWIVLAEAGVLSTAGMSSGLLDALTWATAAFLAVNTLSNLAARSRLERWGMGTATFVAAVLTALVAAA